MRDSQKSKVYKWENRSIWMQKTSILTEKEVTTCLNVLNRQLTSHYRKTLPHTNAFDRIRPRTLQFANGRGCSYAMGRHIVLKRQWALSAGVLLHEYAHTMTFDLHGEDFVGCYSALVHHYLHVPVNELARGLNKVNIQFTSIHDWLTKMKLRKSMQLPTPLLEKSIRCQAPSV
jgi:hypothetical protein